MPDIGSRQNEDLSIDLLAAQRQLYEDAKRLRRVRLGVSIAVTVSSLAVAATWAWAAAYAGLVAVGWIVGESLVRTKQRALVDTAAVIQEQFDTTVFALPWNDALGTVPSPWVVQAAARRYGGPGRAGLVDWYTVGGGSSPLDVLTCQAQNVHWTAGLSDGWARWVRAGLGVLVAGGLGVALVSGFTLADTLLVVFVPLLPLGHQAAEADTGTRRRADEVQRVAAVIAVAKKTEHLAPGTVDLAVCRGIQDAIWVSRRTLDPIPTWYYARRRARDEAETSALSAAH